MKLNLKDKGGILTCLHQGAGKRPGSKKIRRKKPNRENPNDLASAYVFDDSEQKVEFKVKIQPCSHQPNCMKFGSFERIPWRIGRLSGAYWAPIGRLSDAYRAPIGRLATIRQQMAEDIQTSPKIGGPSTIVEIDEAKFGKQKFNRGRPVQGTWLAGGVQRHYDFCFLAVCPGNYRDAGTLGNIVQTYVRRGTTVITDRWKGQIREAVLDRRHPRTVKEAYTFLKVANRTWRRKQKIAELMIQARSQRGGGG